MNNFNMKVKTHKFLIVDIPRTTFNEIHSVMSHYEIDEMNDINITAEEFKMDIDSLKDELTSNAIPKNVMVLKMLYDSFVFIYSEAKQQKCDNIILHRK